MRAAFTDSHGPRRWRMLPYLVPFAALAFAIFGPVEGAAAQWIGWLAVAAFNLLGVPSRRLWRAREVEVIAHPGRLEIKNAGTRSQTIRTKDIVGATTARSGSGVLITLQHARRDQPIALEVASDKEANEIRQALGIGHGGFGSIAWRTTATPGARMAIAGRLLAGGLPILCLTLSALNMSAAASAFGLLLGFFAFIGMLLGIGNLLGSPGAPTVIMTPHGLRLLTQGGWFFLPYDSALGVNAYEGTLIFDVPPPYHALSVETAQPMLGGLTPSDRACLVAQIHAASQRARGLGPEKQDATARLEALRRNGQSVRDWLVRLDMQGQLLKSGAGYRGTNMDPEDLWAVLEDPDADAELRAAAARVLRHSPRADARVRIDAAVATVRDDATTKRLRIAIEDDLDAASDELAALEQHERVRIFRGA